MENLVDQLKNDLEQVQTLMERLEIEAKAREIERLEEEASAPEFWSNANEAKRIMQHIAHLKDEVNTWHQLRQQITDAIELAELGDEMLEDLIKENQEIGGKIKKLSLQATLSGPYDAKDAILAIHAGAGGVDAQDWAQMLERMYLRWIEQNGYHSEILDRSEGEEAGIKSTMISVRGAYAYGYLKSEQGVHRLVRISPFDSAARRHTAFAKVELWPDIDEDIDIEINEKDLRIDTYRASGAGGQHVQKNDTAVRITHLPTGIVVQCQNQRSQLQNRERAMQILRARLFEIERSKKEAELASIKGENVDAGWGNQIRSYILHPYQMVKDHRTGVEVGNINAVLDGRLSDFMEAYLRAKISGTLSTSLTRED